MGELISIILFFILTMGLIVLNCITLYQRDNAQEENKTLRVEATEHKKLIHTMCEMIKELEDQH
jgi:hypothetical protein